MKYKSILLNLDIDGHVAPLIKFALDLARHFDARLIGLSAADVPPPFVSSDGMAFGGEIVVRQQADIGRRVDELRKEFEELAGATLETEWRGSVGNPTRLLVGTARAADLIVTGSPEDASVSNVHRSIDLGSVVLQAGRPMLIASNGQAHLQANKVLVAWKETREARRAVADAIPFLQMAREVRVITIDNDPTDETWNSLTDIVSFLSHHGVKAGADVFPEKSNGQKIADLAMAMNADLVISGAYGHSRFREWVFGGATRSLLENHGMNRFMSS